MPTKQDFKAAQERILSRVRTASASDQEMLRKTEDDGVYSSALNIKAIRLDRIVPDPNRPVRSYGEESLAELAQSLRLHGQLVPILVQYLSDDDVFVLVDGERRWRAAQRAGLPALQAVILGRQTSQQRYEQQLASTLHQEVWDLRERAQALYSFKEHKGLTTWAEVAQRLGLSEAAVNTIVQTGEMLAAEADEQFTQAENTSADEPTGDSSTVTDQIVAAVQLLDQALSQLQPGEGNSADIARALNLIDGCLGEHRVRLIHSGGKPQPPEEKKRVRNMPTWG
jgi:ParB family chromosome partitioning protein